MPGRLTIVILVLTASVACSTGAPANRPPNIVLVLADDLGYGDLGSYGQTRIQTPTLDRLAAEGMRFTDFYAGSTVCAPSRAVLMTGRHTGHNVIRGNREVQPMGQHPLPAGEVTVAEVLQQAGYRTALIGKWGLGGPDSEGVPNAQGFDEFYGYLGQRHAHNYYPEFVFRNAAREALNNVVPDARPSGAGRATVRTQYTHDLFVDEALTFVRANQDRPFFLYLAVTIPHANNEAGPAGMEVPDYGPYEGEDWPDPQKGLAAMITRLDTDLGRLMTLIASLGLDDETLVIFTSDNGPHREGGNDPDFFDSNGPLRGIKRSLYEGGIRVPMIARWPGRVPAGTTTAHIGYQGDLLATLAELAGATAPEGLDSLSLVPTLVGDPDRQPQHPYLYWEFYEQGSRQAVRMGRWKGVRQPMLTGPIELFDLAADLSETRDVTAEHPDVVDRIRAALDEAHVPSALWTVPRR